MDLIRNKKGIFFTILVVVILSLFLLTYTFYSGVTDRKSIQKRIETMNNFLFSVEQDIPRQIFTSGFRIIFLFEKRVIETNTYITDLEGTFEEVFYQGTLYGQTNEDITLLMQGAKFSDIVDSIKEKGDKIGVDIDLLNPILTVEQEDPWNVKVSLTTTLQMVDKSELATWNRTARVSAFIPIEGFEDPIYSINTWPNTITNPISRTPTEPLTSEDLLSHAENSYYIASTEAPSFLDRLEGKITEQNANGIESLVYIPEIIGATPGVSIVDHEYFSSSPPAGNSVSGCPFWFLLDTVTHSVIYPNSC
jgi:hypothetical protein